MIKKLLGIILLFATILTAPACSQKSVAPQQQVKTGIDVLVEQDFEPLKGKRVGLITNATGVDKNLRSTVDLLNESENVELVALYGPEHGVRGDISAGDKFDTYIDERTGIEVFSLYGKTRKPTNEMLENVDVLVYDIQDIGVRSYTFISTLGLAMEAAQENGIEVMVLDRPNPLGGFKIEGNVVEDGYYSFISQYPTPYVYGLTPGEFALLLNGEKMLTDGVQAELTVIGMEGWKRSMTFDKTGLSWVPTSPHIPHANSAYYYVASGILGELGIFSEGVGYTTPFEVFAAEWIDENDLAETMNGYGLEGVLFRPLVFKPYYGRDVGKTLRGVQIHFTDYTKTNLMELQLWFLQAHHELYPDKNAFEIGNPSRPAVFDKVIGTDKIREMFSKNFKVSDVQEYLHKDVESFRKTSQKYYLYN
ncbi:MAG: DUF1343 domain-containing protein [Balneolaceae bacterium]